MMRGEETKSRRIQGDVRRKDVVNLNHLPPSYELIEHYRSRLKKLDLEYESLSEFVKDCQAICTDASKSQQELLQRDIEVSQLQQAVSDLQVYIFQERKQVLSLFAENDRLKIKNAELLRRNEVLHSISGVSEEELTLFVKQSGSRTIEVPRRNAQKKANKGKTINDANLLVDSDEVDLLRLRVQALEAQLSEQRLLHEDEITALRQDREILRAERTDAASKYEQSVKELASQLNAARQQVCKLTSELVHAKQQHRGVEVDWLTERESLLKVAKDQSGDSYSNKNLVLPGGGTKNCGMVSILREQLAEREKLLATYQEQCVAMETQVRRLHEQTENSKALFKDKVQKMASQVAYLRSKYAELDRRRLTDAEGFRSDIRLMRTRLRELERGFKKLGVAPRSTGASATVAVSSASGSRCSACSSNTSSDVYLASTARDTMHRARQLEAELKNIQNKVMNLESELQLENDK